MLAENELYVAILTFDDRSLDRDDPNWEANLQKAQKGLDQAKESCQRLAARGQSKGSIFWQPHDLRDMNSMVSCTRGLIQQIKNQLRDVEYEARASPSPTETSMMELAIQRNKMPLSPYKRVRKMLPASLLSRSRC